MLKGVSKFGHAFFSIHVTIKIFTNSSRQDLSGILIPPYDYSLPWQIKSFCHKMLIEYTFLEAAIFPSIE